MITKEGRGLPEKEGRSMMSTLLRLIRELCQVFPSPFFLYVGVCMEENLTNQYVDLSPAWPPPFFSLSLCHGITLLHFQLQYMWIMTDCMPLSEEASPLLARGLVQCSRGRSHLRHHTTHHFSLQRHYALKARYRSQQFGLPNHGGCRVMRILSPPFPSPPSTKT